MPLTYGTRIGPYEVLAPLGAGGMGEVYRARDLRLDRLVALKVIPSQFADDATFRERFEREARAASGLNHPNICTVYDVGTDPPFIAMELLDGETLHQRLLRGALDQRQLVDVGIALADALDVAHQHGIIHRDIKPSNIFLTARGPKIVDFGLAKIAVPDQAEVGSHDPTRTSDTLFTDPGTTVGTVAYMSPEQLRGERVDVRSDLFSLGLVLYEMATGRPAFGGATRAAVSGAILYETPTAPREVQGDLSLHLDAIILKALEKDRDIRCQTASEIRADLKRLKREFSGGPALGPTPHVSASTRVVADQHSDVAIATSLARRHWRALAAISSVAAIAIVALLSVVKPWRAGDTPPSVENLRVVQLTTSGNAESPAISPDGKYVAHVQHDGSDDSLWIRQVATPSNVQIVPPQAGVVLWGATVTPDGNFVDFVRRSEGGPFELWRVPLFGGAAKRFVERVNSPIGWSPDGRRFAFVRADPGRGTTALVVTNADGTEERTLRERQRPAQFLSLMLAVRPSIRPAWSPDGRLIALPGAGVLGGPRTADVDVVDATTGSERTVPLPSATVRGLVWMDDKSLLLDAAESGAAEAAPVQLWRLAYPGGQLSRLTNDLNDYSGVSITADRLTVATGRRESRQTVWTGDGTGRNLTEVARVRGGEIAWAGDRLLYTANVTGQLSLWLRDGAAAQEVVSQALNAAATSDGKTIVFIPIGAGRDGVWKTDADGRHGVQLVSGDAAYPTVTRDDANVIFLSARGSQQSPWIVPIAGGRPRQIADVYAGAPGVDVSPDGRSILFMSRDAQQNRTTWVVCQLPDCGSRRALPALGDTTVRWTPDGRGIAYVDAATNSNVWVLPLEGGAPSQLTNFTDRTVQDLAWSHDGTRLAVSRTLTINDIVLFKGLMMGR